MKPEVNSGKAEVPTDCAKHSNVKAEVNSGKAEVPTDCAKHSNVKPEVNSGKAVVRSHLFYSRIQVFEPHLS
ncbi:hypothetical protein PQG02_28620 [Nostoc sp. UHCC 0926]|uniref:hypothetical protein n=1 Tax=unclassified Nostoc TaxID=2593658 RepID=UPI00235F32B9|nr:hypothetical protein [Nostoc sp. UHCC 0926]WDD32569.1 hypothetical protein PQG02_28620 [Nostoc sp. UHCC 0926]